MSLQISFNCFDGGYGLFSDFRTEIAKKSGIFKVKEDWYIIPKGKYKDENFYGIWETDPEDILEVLLVHSDCQGDIHWKYCKPLADRLEGLGIEDVIMKQFIYDILLATGYETENEDNDFAFIAAASRDISALLALVRAQQELLRECLPHMRHWYEPCTCGLDALRKRIEEVVK